MNKGYYAIIPATIRYDDSLNPNAKLLYGEITALCNEKGYCWASDSYFSNLYNVSKSTVQRWFKQLEEQGYIKRTVVYEKGTLKIKHRYTHLCEYPIPKNEHTPIRKNERDNNTVINITSNNTKPYVEIINYLNDVADKSYKATTEKTKRSIKARINEGFSVDDFKKVIDKKVDEWKGTNMAKYIRPETLFGNKFEGYLNEEAGGKNTIDWDEL